MRCAVCALAFALSAAPARAAEPIFVFHADGFWLNLHHFLYVLGRAEAHLPDATREAVAGAPADAIRGAEQLTFEERHAWREAITFYANGLSRKDAIFDEPLPTIARALADVGDSAPLVTAPTLDAPLRATLLRVAPLYRNAWWPAHHAANIARRSAIQSLVDRHGVAVRDFVTRVYGMVWPSDVYPVHFSGWANWAGAYSNPARRLLVVSSLDRETDGLDGLEIAFHEAMHQWDDRMQALLFAAARKAGTRLPPNVSHAMIFFTAGDAIRRVAPDHVPYADAYGVWDRGFQRFRAPLEQVWKPYLDGKGTRDEAIAALVAAVGVARQH
jgi:hypothetical protein